MNRWISMGLLRKIGFFALLGLAALVAAGPVLTLVSAILSLALALLALVIPLALAGLLVWLALRAVYPGSPDALETLIQRGRDLSRSALAGLGPRFAVLGTRAQRLGQLLRQSFHELAGLLRQAVTEVLYAAGSLGRKVAARFPRPDRAGSRSWVAQLGRRAWVLVREAGRCLHWLLRTIGQAVGALPWRAALMLLARGGAWVRAVLGRLAKGLRDGFWPVAGYLSRMACETLCGALVGGLLGTIAGWQGEPYEPAIYLGAAIGAVLGALVGVVDAHRTRASQSAEC